MEETFQHNGQTKLNRRAFLYKGSLFLTGTSLLGKTITSFADDAPANKPKIRIGMITDVHYADKEPIINRYYRESLQKFADAVKQFDKDKPDFTIELGDLIDSADSLDVEKGYLKRIAKHFASTPGMHHYVLGNHCVWNLTKPEFLRIVGQKRAYYSFNVADHHFIILDACFKSDGTPYGRQNFNWKDANIPQAEIAWLQSDLSKTQKKSIIFIHQRLDKSGPEAVKNKLEIRNIFEQSGKVKAVFQGHSHVNDYWQIEGIHYCTMAAMVEGSGKDNNAYLVVNILPNDVIQVQGFGRQKEYEWK